MKATINVSRLLILAIPVLGTLISMQSSAATFTLNPSSDAFVTTGFNGSLSTSNYGGAGALAIAPSTAPAGEFQSVLQFGLSGAKTSFDSQFGVGQWTIQSITLQFTAGPPNNPIFNTNAAGLFNISWMQNDSWLEGTGTPQAPTNTGITFATLSNFVSSADESLGVFSFNGGSNGNSIYTLGLSPSLYAETLAGSTISLRMFAADNSIAALFDSRSFNMSPARPLLTITAIPEPGSLAICLLGIGIVTQLRFRRR